MLEVFDLQSDDKFIQIIFEIASQWHTHEIRRILLDALLYTYQMCANLNKA